MNMELVFDIVFNNDNSFNDITAEKAKMLVCTYKIRDSKGSDSSDIGTVDEDL